MRLLLPSTLSLLLLALQSVCAQPADDFFNSGAQFYISNNIANAKQVVEGGLKLYPDNVKLKKLEELLKQQQQQQQQNQNQQQQNQHNQQNQQKQSQQNQQNQQQNQKPQDQQQNQQQQQPQPAQSSKGQSGEKSSEPGGQTQASAAREMTPEEAKRLLDAQKGDEQILQLKPKNPPESPNKPIKDW
jgi:Ca-activated chloride channel family protein